MIQKMNCRKHSIWSSTSLSFGLYFVVAVMTEVVLKRQCRLAYLGDRRLVDRFGLACSGESRDWLGGS